MDLEADLIGDWILDDHARGYEISKSLLVREGVARADWTARLARGRTAPKLNLDRLFGAASRQSLQEATPVDQGGRHVELVKAVGDHGHQQNNKHEQQAEPEGRSWEQFAENSVVIEAESWRVGSECNCKKEGDWAPNDDVIEDSPIGGVECSLGGHNNNQVCAHNRSEKLVIVQVGSLGVCCFHEGAISYEESCERGYNSVCNTLQKFVLVEEQVDVSGRV